MNEPGIVGGNCFSYVTDMFGPRRTFLRLVDLLTPWYRNRRRNTACWGMWGGGGGGGEWKQSQGLLKVHPSIFCHLFRSGLGDSRFIEVTLNQHLNLGYPEASPDKKPNLLSMSQLDMPRRLSLEDANSSPNLAPQSQTYMVWLYAWKKKSYKEPEDGNNWKIRSQPSENHCGLHRPEMM